mgnify:CR=1 FL=1
MYLGEKLIKREPFRWGIVGGDKTSQVGYKHRLGAMRDNTSFLLTAAAFDVDAERGREFGVSLGMDADRCYPDYKTMFEEEAKREDGIEVVDVATPNFLHYEVTKAALEAGLHVICEKPLFFEAEQGEEIKKLAEEKGKIVAVRLLRFRTAAADARDGNLRQAGQDQYDRPALCTRLWLRSGRRRKV